MRDSFLAHVRGTVDQIRADGFYKSERVIASPQSAMVHLAAGDDVLKVVRLLHSQPEILIRVEPGRKRPVAATEGEVETALANFRGGEFFHRRPDGVAVGDAKEKRPNPSLEGEPSCIICH